MLAVIPNGRIEASTFLKCPCNSRSYVGRVQLSRPLEGKDDSQIVSMVKQLNATYSRLAKQEITSCLWWGFYNDPLVAAIFELEHKVNHNPAAFHEGLPAILYDGFLLYQSTKVSVRNQIIEADDKEREAKRKRNEKKSVLKPGRKLG